MQYNDRAVFVRLPLYSCKYKTNLIPAGSFLHIQKHLLAGKGGKEKRDGFFNLLIKVKKHPGSLSEIHSAVKKTQFHSCEEKL